MKYFSRFWGKKKNKNRTTCQSRTIYPAKLSRQSVEITINHKFKKKKECEIKTCLPLINADWNNSQRCTLWRRTLSLEGRTEKRTEEKKWCKEWHFTYIPCSVFLRRECHLHVRRISQRYLVLLAGKPKGQIFDPIASSSTASGLPVGRTQACSVRWPYNGSCVWKNRKCLTLPETRCCVRYDTGLP